MPPLPQQEHHVRRSGVGDAVHHAAQPHALTVAHSWSQRHLHLLPIWKVRPQRIRLLDGHALRRPVVELLQRHLQLVPQIAIAGRLRRPAEGVALPRLGVGGASSEEGIGSEEILKHIVAEEGAPSKRSPHATHTHAANIHPVFQPLQPFLPEPVVHGPLPLAAQHVVRLADFVERGPVPFRFIGVGEDASTTVGLLYLGLGGRFGDAEHVVVTRLREDRLGGGRQRR
mmetsp:Transcript_43880/g.93325  ORF Transcript_43880/g.93325 Transcript_43880/m.93325 type:complete len:228 (-) Transcript_43880:320-1003(-)